MSLNNVTPFPVIRASSVALTPRECEVMDLLYASALTNADLALALECSKDTIRAHFRSIFLKLDVGSRTEAVLVWGRTMRRAA